MGLTPFALLAAEARRGFVLGSGPSGNVDLNALNLLNNSGRTSKYTTPTLETEDLKPVII